MASKVTEIIVTIGTNKEDFAVSIAKQNSDSDVERIMVSSADLSSDTVSAVNAILDTFTDLADVDMTRAEVVTESQEA